MKAIQITMDEALLERFDRDPAVLARGRSAVLRELATEHLRRQREAALKTAYAKGYADGAIEDELDDWINASTATVGSTRFAAWEQ